MCDDNFDDTAADAICKTMNFTGAIRWTAYDDRFDNIKYNYRITLDDVSCSRAEWTSCTYDSYSNDCGHSEDVLLSCRTNDQGNEQANLIFTHLSCLNLIDHIIIVLKK